MIPQLEPPSISTTEFKSTDLIQGTFEAWAKRVKFPYEKGFLWEKVRQAYHDGWADGYLDRERIKTKNQLTNPESVVA